MIKIFTVDLPFRECVERLSQKLNNHELWDVLTALRGPDNEGLDIKSATTAVIRKAIGLDPYDSGVPAYVIDSDSEKNVAVRKNMNVHYTHFCSHAYSAFCALGLKWEEVNDLTVLYPKY